MRKQFEVHSSHVIQRPKVSFVSVLAWPAFLFLLTTGLPVAAADDPIREWVEANIEQWDSDQREAACLALEAVLDDVDPPLSPQERDALIQATPFFLESVGVVKGISHEIEVELLSEVYRGAVQDYSTRALMDEETKETADEQRGELFEYIEEEVSRITDTVTDEPVSDAVWAFVEELEARWEQAAANPLSPYYKQALDEAEYRRIQADIRQRVDDYLAAMASSDEDPARPPDIVGGMPVQLLVLVRGLFELETASFMRPRSELQQAIEVDLYEAGLKKAQEEERKWLAESQAQRDASDASMQLHMAGSEASYALKEHIKSKESAEHESPSTSESTPVERDRQIEPSAEDRREGLPAFVYALLAGLSALVGVAVVIGIRHFTFRRLSSK